MRELIYDLYKKNHASTYGLIDVINYEQKIWVLALNFSIK